MNLEGRTALITGAATGIGRAACVAFAAQGAKVLIGDIDQRAEETVAIIRQSGGEAGFLHANVTDPAAMDALVAACLWVMLLPMFLTLEFSAVRTACTAPGAAKSMSGSGTSTSQTWLG
jgi:hypothetical protein